MHGVCLQVSSHPHAEDQVGKVLAHLAVQIGGVLQVHGVPISLLKQILGQVLLQEVLGVLLALYLRFRSLSTIFCSIPRFPPASSA